MQKIFSGSLILVPLALLAHYHGGSDILVFFLAAAAIIPLAKYLGEATEELASLSSPALGGLLNATFGNATELIIGILALNAGLIGVVKASIAGSIIGNLLLVVGASIFIGGLRHKQQSFNRIASAASTSILFLAAIALVIPAFFNSTTHGASNTHELSVLVAIVMFVVYLAYLVFIFLTHPHLYKEEFGHIARWSRGKSIVVLAACTIFIGWLSEILVNAIKPTLVHLGWTELFVGAVIVAIIGNIAEHTSAVTMAARNRMDLSLQISIGSATQVALFVTPVLVFAGALMHKDMNLVFGTFELVAIVLAIMITNLVIQDGESNWHEGAQLMAAYGIIAAAFFLYPA